MLKNDVLSLLESVDSNLALSDVLIDRQREPVVVGDTLVHMLVKLFNINFQKLLLDWLQVGHGRLVSSQELVQFVDVNHVVLFLKSNVDDCLRNGLADSIEELGFSDDDSELTGKVHLVGLVLILDLWGSRKNVSILSSEILDGLVSVLSLPGLKDLLFIIFVELLGKSDILVGNILKNVGHELVGLVSELADGTLDSSHDRSGPGNLTCLGWHVLRNWRVFDSFLEKNLHLSQLLVILNKYILVFPVKQIFDSISSLNILELREEIKGSFRRSKLMSESTVDQGDNMRINLLNLSDKLLELSLPLIRVLFREDVSWERLKFADLVPDSVLFVLDLLGTTGDSS